MKLPPGSTGLAPPSSGTDRDGELHDFLTACHHAARLSGGAVTNTSPAGTTPNFHTAVITYPNGEQVTVLAHIVLPLLALAEPTPSGETSPVFLDRPALRSALAQASTRAILTPGQLNRALSDTDLTALSNDERRQVDYWNPDTVGALLFNHWD